MSWQAIAFHRTKNWSKLEIDPKWIRPSLAFSITLESWIEVCYDQEQQRLSYKQLVTLPSRLICSNIIFIEIQTAWVTAYSSLIISLKFESRDIVNLSLNQVVFALNPKNDYNSSRTSAQVLVFLSLCNGVDVNNFLYIFTPNYKMFWAYW